MGLLKSPGEEIQCKSKIFIGSTFEKVTKIIAKFLKLEVSINHCIQSNSIKSQFIRNARI